ncbi:MAG: glycosyltransferase [Aestuariivita sp.]|nr:glycosyltransferase [Aestuariivita sp.]MCY4201509.1 glycosyltransferase [Aestuariivita sp.]
MPKYYFEVSSLREYLKHNTTLSGLQRVAHKVIFHAAQELGKDNVRLLYFDEFRGRHIVFSASPLLYDEYLSIPELRSALLVSVDRIALFSNFPALERYSSNPLKYRFHLARFILAERNSNKHFFLKRGTTLEEWRRHYKTSDSMTPANDKRLDYRSKEGLEERLEPNDVICILNDNIFTRGANILLPQIAKKVGAKIYTMVHDLIPLVRVDESGCHPGLFRDWLSSTAINSAGLIANSQHTSEILRKYLEANNFKTPIKLIPLAQSGLCDPSLTQPNEVVDELGNTLSSNISKLTNEFSQKKEVRTAAKLPFVLCVGNIEGRKNCWRIAQAWAQLALVQDLELPRLVFAGKYGGLTEDFLKAYTATGGWGGWVLIVERPSDDELDFLYRRCAFTITASLYEGWGLTIGESLSYGKTAVVSDLTAMPEVGGDLVEYCDPYSIASIAASVRRLVEEPERKKELEDRISRAKLRQWSDVGRDLAKVIGHNI